MSGEGAFRNGIRARDGNCVITGVNLGSTYPVYETAHVFPLEKESLWIQSNYGRWITDMDGTNGVSKINSLQNGFLLRKDVHTLFDQYLVSVNPDVCLFSH